MLMSPRNDNVKWMSKRLGSTRRLPARICPSAEYDDEIERLLPLVKKTRQLNDAAGQSLFVTLSVDDGNIS